jgi:hypothetical protein
LYYQAEIPSLSYLRISSIILLKRFLLVLPGRDSFPFLSEDSIYYSLEEIPACVTRQRILPLLLSEDSINYSFEETPACVPRQRFPPQLLSEDSINYSFEETPACVIRQRFLPFPI